MLRKKALEELNTVLEEQQEFIKVHAAEYLIWLGYKKNVRSVFLKENKLHGTEPRYRIGIWRVLAQTENTAAGRAKWVNRVLNVFGNMNVPDRLHSAETLGKLRTSPLSKFPEANEFFPAAKRIELAMALAENGSTKDVPLLASFPENKKSNGIYENDSKEAADVRAAAAYAILKLTK